MGGVFTGLVAAGAVAALLSVGSASQQLTRLSPTHDTPRSEHPESDPARLWSSGEGQRFFRF